MDAVIFRVLFAVLSFFGGVGLLAYGLAWLLVPEPGVGVSVLDRAVHQLRLRRVPPWLVIIGGGLAVWITWFSWWAPGPTFPAIMLLAVLAVVLLHRMGNRPAPMAAPPWPAPGRPPPRRGLRRRCRSPRPRRIRRLVWQKPLGLPKLRTPPRPGVPSRPGRTG